ncbi:MAG: hypothetical protein ACYS47_06855 [Planctomycetota bacterium]|jgi:hypothetical protein
MTILANPAAPVGLLLVILLQDPNLTGDKIKFPVPSVRSQALGSRTVSKRYRKEIKSKDRDARLTLAAKLIEASKTEKDRGIKYALMARAEKIGREEADAELVIRAVDGIFRTFDIHPIEAKSEGLLKTYKFVKDEAPAKKLVEAGFTVIDDCIAALQSGFVKSLEKLIKKAGRKTKDPAYEKQVAGRIAEARERYKKAEMQHREFQQTILSWADSKRGEQVGGGECLDFVRAALVAAKADLNFPYYVFGRRLYPGEMPLPGDVLTLFYTDGGGTARHHVVLITEVMSPMRFSVLHQNVGGVRNVVEGMYDLKSYTCDYYFLYRPVRTDRRK